MLPSKSSTGLPDSLEILTNTARLARANAELIERTSARQVVTACSHCAEILRGVDLEVLEGDGRVSEHVGGYGDWVAKGGRLAALDEPLENDASCGEETSLEEPPARPADAGTTRGTTPPAPAKSRKLSYKDQRELEALPERIEALEAQLAKQQAAVAQPDFYSRPHTETHTALEALATTQSELDAAYARWEELLA